jgi:hypothetical protein
MTRVHWIAVLVISIASAQTPTERAYQGQSWVGLLVSASCDKSHGSKSNRESDLTVDHRTTTPAVDDAGTRGSAETKAVDEKQSMPETGDVLDKGKSATDPGWKAARKQAQALDASCAVGAEVTRFALLLSNGKMVQFDELANQAITKQLSARPAGTGKFIRVSVQGKLQDGKIALDSIQM